MDATGAQIDDSKIRALVAALEGVDIDKAISEAVAVGTTPTAEADSKDSPEKDKENKEEKTEEEKKEEEAKGAAGLGALFG